MSKFTQGRAFVLKSIVKNKTLIPHHTSLAGKTYIVSGGSRGIGYNIAEKLVAKGANVSILGKTVTPHKKLENTIYSAAIEINNQSFPGNCIGIPCDVRDPPQIDNAIKETMRHFNERLDGVVLNASALCLNTTLKQTLKEVNLMTDVNIKGSFLMGKKCLEYISKSKSDAGNVLIIAPPMSMIETDDWWVDHLYYSMSKFNMTLMARYWNKEFPNVAVNTLWPRTTIDTAPVRNLLGGQEMVNISRTADIMGDAARHIFLANPKKCTGFHFIDDEVIASVDGNVEKYRVDPTITEKELMPDFFC